MVQRLHRRPSLSYAKTYSQGFTDDLATGTPARPGHAEVPGRSDDLATSRESLSIGLAFWHVVAYYGPLGGYGRPSALPESIFEGGKAP